MKVYPKYANPLKTKGRRGTGRPKKKMKRLIYFKREGDVRTKTEAVKKENN